MATVHEQVHRLPLWNGANDMPRLDQEGFVIRSDAASSRHFARDLEFIEAKTYDEQFPELKMANGDVIPIDTSVPVGATTFGYRMFRGVSHAILMHSYAAGNLPGTDVRGSLHTQRTVGIGNYYGWGLDDVYASQFTGMPLDRDFSRNAKRAHHQQWNYVGLFGDNETEIRGLINHQNITVLSAPDSSGTPGNSTWEVKTGTEILADLNAVINVIPDQTLEMENANQCAMPSPLFRLIAEQIMSVDNTETVLTVIRRQRPEVNFYPLLELSPGNSIKPGQSGAAAQALSSRAIFAYRKGDSKAELVMPQRFTQQPLQQIDLFFKIPCHSKIGGTRMRYPRSAARMDGV